MGSRLGPRPGKSEAGVPSGKTKTNKQEINSSARDGELCDLKLYEAAVENQPGLHIKYLGI